MLVILLSLSLGYTGNRNALKSTPGLDSDRALAQVSGGAISAADVDEKGNYIDPLSQITLERAQSLFSDYKIVQVYNDKQLFWTNPQTVTVDDKLLSSNKNPSSEFNNQYSEDVAAVVMRDNELLLEDVRPDQTITIGSDGSLPVLVNTDVLLLLEGKTFTNESAQEKVDITAALTEKYLGKTITLGLTKSDASLKLRIIGYAPKDSLLYSFTRNIYLPTSVVGDAQKLEIEAFIAGLDSSKESDSSTPEDAFFPVVQEQSNTSPFAEDYSTQAIIEFANTGELQRFIKDKSCTTNFSEDCLSIYIPSKILF